MTRVSHYAAEIFPLIGVGVGVWMGRQSTANDLRSCIEMVQRLNEVGL